MFYESLYITGLLVLHHFLKEFMTSVILIFVSKGSIWKLGFSSGWVNIYNNNYMWQNICCTRCMWPNIYNHRVRKIKPFIFFPISEDISFFKIWDCNQYLFLSILEKFFSPVPFEESRSLSIISGTFKIIHLWETKSDLCTLKSNVTLRSVQ